METAPWYRTGTTVCTVPYRILGGDSQPHAFLVDGTSPRYAIETQLMRAGLSVARSALYDSIEVSGELRGDQESCVGR